MVVRVRVLGKGKETKKWAGTEKGGRRRRGGERGFRSNRDIPREDAEKDVLQGNKWGPRVSVSSNREG